MALNFNDTKKYGLNAKEQQYVNQYSKKKMLQSLREKVCVMQRNKQLLYYDSKSDVDWSSWIDTDVTEDGRLQNLDYVLPEAVKEGSITTSGSRGYSIRNRRRQLNLIYFFLKQLQKWLKAYEHPDDDVLYVDTHSYALGLLCLDRLAIALGGNTIFPVASEQLPAYLAAPEWRKHHAALVALAQISQGCSKVMIENSEQVVTMVLNSFHDPHPRVRWAAIDAIEELSIYLGPHLQLQYHARVLPALASAMDDFENPRVQDCTPDIWTPYLDGMVSKLLVLLQSGTKMVQEGALTALELVAHKSSEEVKVVKEEPGSGAKNGKGASSSKPTSATGPVTEDEIRAVLLHKASATGPVTEV
ncbi:hypothetical protein CTI12_AA108950 [Artemisia annua]|uniref:Uncharacterized protein n=1 Tax=Artemisia annua TaxID=35608 RepID=A0A2U1PV51_ARTAN|nr:hypothetical protein CTI12_AA108950 [Artemisia annua]